MKISKAKELYSDEKLAKMQRNISKKAEFFKNFYRLSTKMIDSLSDELLSNCIKKSVQMDLSPFISIVYAEAKEIMEKNNSLISIIVYDGESDVKFDSEAFEDIAFLECAIPLNCNIIRFTVKFKDSFFQESCSSKSKFLERIFENHLHIISEDDSADTFLIEVYETFFK